MAKIKPNVALYELLQKGASEKYFCIISKWQKEGEKTKYVVMKKGSGERNFITLATFYKKYHAEMFLGLLRKQYLEAAIAGIDDPDDKEDEPDSI